MDKYGGECVACGERDVFALQLDHVHDDGAVCRRLGLDRPGNGLYADLLKRPRRPDLQILCANCNQRKRHHGSEFENWPLTPRRRKGRIRK